MIAAIGKVCAGLYHRPVNKRGLKRAAVWGIAAVASVLVILLVLVPALADRLAEFVPPEREVALGDAVAGQVGDLLRKDNGEAPAVCSAPEGAAALEQMTGRLTPAEGLPYPLRVSVLDHPMINAVALPGGRILIFRGLIDAANSPEEVAGVLAHEIGHVVHRDPVRGVLRAAGTAGIVGVLLGDVFGATVIAAASDAVLNASHQREAEQKADEAAYGMLREAGLPSRQFAGFFSRLKDRQGGTGGPLRYLASHPDLGGRAERAAAADTIGEGPFTPVLNDRDWIALQNICDEGRALDAG